MTAPQVGRGALSLDALIQQRLANQRITRTVRSDPARLVQWLGAVQAQEFGPAKWGLGRRLPAAVTDAKIQRAFDAGRLLRTHVMRPTWHFVAPADIRWMLELTGASVHRRMATYHRRMGLDSGMFVRAANVCEHVLEGGQFLTRQELSTHFARAGLPHRGYRVGHLALYCEVEGVICSGPRRGKQSTYALLAERAPDARRLPRDEALAELAQRYFRSHGPATLRDFVWWSGLKAADARRGLEMHRATKVEFDGQTYWTLGRTRMGRPRAPQVSLLPVYDEYLVAYRDRIVVPHGPAMVPARVAGYVKFQHPLVIAGQVVGTWRPGPRADDGMAEVRVAPARRLTAVERRGLAREVARYRLFHVASPSEAT
ncbi:MAG TPA: winged helix DNA-binding domain-containing protein [Gemmatimonadales bacterium]|jgi:hypothetical protein|nr:winged helix DNA-binding domain-containing protein [Gemmatimonadales bacterium]